MSLRQRIIRLHHWFETLPDKLYPFRAEIEGKWVRGKAAYQKLLEDGFALHGHGRVGYKLTIYRGAWHIAGSILLIAGIVAVSNRWSPEGSLAPTLLLLAIVALFLQEFILHPRRYGQSFNKGLFDVATWLTPIAIYVLFF